MAIQGLGLGQRLGVEGEGGEGHGDGVEDEEAVGEQFAGGGEEFDGFGSLKRADDTNNAVENAGDRAWLVVGGLFVAEECAKIGCCGQVGEQMAGESRDGTVDERFAEADAGVVDEQARGVVVGAVDDEVVVGKDFGGVVVGEKFVVGDDVDCGVDAQQ